MPERWEPTYELETGKPYEPPAKKTGIPWPERTPKTALELERERRRAFERQQEELRARYETEEREQVLGGIQPQPRYAPSFYQMYGRLEGTQAYLRYFRGYFPELVKRFEARLPTYKGFKTAEMAMGEAEKIQETWAEYLRKKRPEVEEEWWGLSPYERGERPSAFAPRIKTVSF